MNDGADFSELDDPAFLALRRRIREEMEHVPEEREARPDLVARYHELNEEFLRRASIAWAQAGQAEQAGNAGEAGKEQG